MTKEKDDREEEEEKKKFLNEKARDKNSLLRKKS